MGVVWIAGMDGLLLDGISEFCFGFYSLLVLGLFLWRDILIRDDQII